MWQVYFKELLELSRDRKTMFFVILLPIIIFPVLFGLMGLVMANVVHKAQSEEFRYVIVHEERAPEFAKRLSYHKNFKQVTSDEVSVEGLTQAIRAGKLDAAIIIPEDFSDDPNSSSQSEFKLIYNDASQMDVLGAEFTKLFNKYRNDIRDSKLHQLGLTADSAKSVLEPITLKTVSTAAERENLGEKIGGFIAYLLVPLCLVGCSYPAIDIGAGEKERGTLETLLICPVSRISLVLGKLFTVLTTGLLATLITVASFGGWGYVIGSLMGVDIVAEAMKMLGVTDLLLILLLLLPLTTVLGSLLLSLSIYARSFKEAQNYIGPLSMIVIMPLMVALLPGVELTTVTALIPVTNIALCVKELVKGTMDMGLLTLVFGQMLVLAAVLVAFSVHWFQREKVLFR